MTSSSGPRSGSLASALVLLVLSAAHLAAQATPPLSGIVVDEVSGMALEGVLVTGPSADFRATTDPAGRFEIELPAGPQPLTFTAYGYVQTELTFDPVTAGSPVRVELTPRPTEIEGFDVEARTFRARLDSINTYLDRSARGERWTSMRGVPRFANREDIMKHADGNDAEIALAALGLYPSFDFECGWRMNGRTVRPARIYLDGEEQGMLRCLRYQETDVSTLCRMELIPTSQGWALFAWSCGFMARLANDDVAVPRLFDVLIPEWWGVGR